MTLCSVLGKFAPTMWVRYTSNNYIILIKKLNFIYKQKRTFFLGINVQRYTGDSDPYNYIFVNVNETKNIESAIKKVYNPPIHPPPPALHPLATAAAPF